MNAIRGIILFCHDDPTEHTCRKRKSTTRQHLLYIFLCPQLAVCVVCCVCAHVCFCFVEIFFLMTPSPMTIVLSFCVCVHVGMVCCAVYQISQPKSMGLP